MIAFADTETTGFPKKGEAKQEGQARILQLAVLLCDDEGNHKTEFSTLIKLGFGTKIDEKAQAVHGITWEDCKKYGMRPEDAFTAFDAIVENAKLLVFHNKAFDLQMLNIESMYEIGVTYEDTIEASTFCTMMASIDECKIPSNYGGYKWPKLSEALKILCNKDIGDDAHDAMVDTRAAKEVYFELKRRGLVGASSNG